MAHSGVVFIVSAVAIMAVALILGFAAEKLIPGNERPRRAPAWTLAAFSCWLVAIALHVLFCDWGEGLRDRQAAVVTGRGYKGSTGTERVEFYEVDRPRLFKTPEGWPDLYSAEFASGTSAALLGVVTPILLIALGVFLHRHAAGFSGPRPQM